MMLIMQVRVKKKVWYNSKMKNKNDMGSLCASPKVGMQIKYLTEWAPPLKVIFL